MQHVYATQTVQMENGSTIKCESYAWLRHSSQTVLAQSRRFLILERIINSILFNAQQIKTKSKMKSIIFFVATIATVLAAPYYPALQVYSNGAVAPVETPEVQHEKAKHFAAHAERSHGYGPVHVAAYAAPHAYGYHVPVIHNGKTKIVLIGGLNFFSNNLIASYYLFTKYIQLRHSLAIICLSLVV